MFRRLRSACLLSEWNNEEENSTANSNGPEYQHVPSKFKPHHNPPLAYWMPFNIFCCLPVVKLRLLKKKIDVFWIVQFSVSQYFSSLSKPNEQKQKGLIIDIILDTEAYWDPGMNMIYFHILLVHFGGNACFEYLAFTVCGALHTLWNHDGCFRCILLKLNKVFCILSLISELSPTLKKNKNIKKQSV